MSPSLSPLYFSHTLSLTHYPLSFSLSLSLTHTLSLSFFLSFSHTLPLYYSLSLSLSLSLSISLYLSLAMCTSITICIVGTTARSSSIRLVLASVCWHLCVMYGLDITDIPLEYPDIVSHFHDLLKVCERIGINNYMYHNYQICFVRLPPKIKYLFRRIMNLMFHT